MSEVFLTPEDSGEVVELSRTLVRKRILPKGSIDYKGRKIVFDDAYLSSVVESFKDNAYDSVPVQMADAANAHTMDPERFSGDIQGLELAEDGLYATMSLTERGAQLIKDNPKLGVSARLVGEYQRSDGKTYPAAMQHVLLTQDPRIPGLGAWTEVDLSGYDGSDQVIDLTNSSYEGEASMSEGKEIPKAETPTDDNIAQALKLIGYTDTEVSEFLAEFDETAETEEAKTDEVKAEASEEETAKVESGEKAEDESAEIVAETEEGKALVASLSNDAAETGTVDLANDDLRTRLAVAEKQLAQSRFEAEKAQWTAKGVPPAFVDLAQDILTAPAGTSVIDLANGPDEDNKVDAADVIRKLIDTTAGYIKLADSRGHDLALSNEPEADAEKADEELTNVWDAMKALQKPTKS